MSALLDVRGLTKTFGGLTAVDDVSFHVDEGEILGLIGPNGAGKTTTFNLLVGLMRPTSGEIVLDGRPVHGLMPHRVAALGMTKTFQTIALFDDLSIEDNVMVGALLRHDSVGEAREAAERVLARVGIGTGSGVAAGELNTVDRARLEVARALATEPRILLLDEAMAGLTPAETDEALRLIRGMREDGITLIVVEHNMRAVMALCDRIVAFDHGAKIAEGTPREIGADAAVIESYLGQGFEHAAH